MSQAVSAQASSAIQTASIWWRTRAAILDLIVIGLLQGLINVTFGSERMSNAGLDPSTSGGFSSYSSTIAVDGIWLWVVAFCYYFVLEGFFGQTLGKVAVGIRVTGLDGRQATPWQIIVRNLLRAIDWLPWLYFLGALVARISGGRQRIGDHLAGTFVVPAFAAVGPWPSAEQRRQRKWIVVALVAIFVLVCGAFSYLGRPPIAFRQHRRGGLVSGGPGFGLRAWNGPVAWRLNHLPGDLHAASFRKEVHGNHHARLARVPGGLANELGAVELLESPIRNYPVHFRSTTG